MATYDRRTVPYIEVHPFPIAKDVALAGKADADDADISLKRGTVLASARNVDGVVIYKPCTDWGVGLVSIVDGPTAGDVYSGTLSHTYIAVNPNIGIDDGEGVVTTSDIVGGIAVDFLTGRYELTVGLTGPAGDAYVLYYVYGDEDGGTWPVGVLLADVDIDSTDDFVNVPVLVAGGISKDDLIYPSGVADAGNDYLRGLFTEAFIATLQYNGIFAR